jgi:hypothetical protein
MLLLAQAPATGFLRREPQPTTEEIVEREVIFSLALWIGAQRTILLPAWANRFAPSPEVRNRGCRERHLEGRGTKKQKPSRQLQFSKCLQPVAARYKRPNTSEHRAFPIRLLGPVFFWQKALSALSYLNLLTSKR